MTLNGKQTYTEQAEQTPDIYKQDVEFFPSVRLEKICEIISDDSLDYEVRLNLIKRELFLC